MSSVAFPTHAGQPARLRDRAAARLRAVRDSAARVAGRPLAGARQHLLTAGGLGCFDVAGFLHSLIIGLCITGVSLLLLDFKMQD